MRRERASEALEKMMSLELRILKVGLLVRRRPFATAIRKSTTGAAAMAASASVQRVSRMTSYAET